MLRSVRVLVVFGTRPEAIKLAPVLHELRQSHDFDTRVCITAQHREMLDQVLRVFDVRPDHDLGIMRAGQGLARVTAKILEALHRVLVIEEPDLVLVQGDTTTCFAAALGAFYAQIPVAHVEAGLRTWNPAAPFPEETNRVLTTKLATWHFAPTNWARDNLLRERVSADNVWVTGNTGIDALLWTQARIRDYPKSRWQDPLGFAWEAVHSSRPLIVITGHRRESFGQGLHNICSALLRLAEEHPNWVFVYPVHLNPNVRAPVYGLLRDTPNIHLLEPLDYESFVYLMDRSQLLLTDSGGIQEEGPSLGKPVLVMRDVTERPEGVEAGCVRLTGTAIESIVSEVRRVMSDTELYIRMTHTENPFGDGHAAARIVSALRRVYHLDG